MENVTNDFPMQPDSLIATLAEMHAASGDALGVAIMATSVPSFQWVGHDFGEDVYRLSLQVPVKLFVQIQDQREELERKITEGAQLVMAAYPSFGLSFTLLSPIPNADEGWRDKALAWLAGSGVSNQGRVRSDNIASREFDGLIFRSNPEINLYRAIKSTGLSFAPLPVFIRGGRDYRRIEPDFVIVSSGVVLVVEVDGDTVHQESPREAHDRTTMLLHEGVHLERVSADACATEDAAKATAQRILQVIQKYSKLH